MEGKESSLLESLLPIAGPAAALETKAGGAEMDDKAEASAGARAASAQHAEKTGDGVAPAGGPGSSPAWPFAGDIVISDGPPLGPPSSSSYLTQMGTAKAFVSAGQQAGQQAGLQSGQQEGQQQGQEPQQQPCRERVPVWVTLGMYEFSNISMISSQYYCRVRVYYMWPADLHAHGPGLADLADRAVKAGEHLKLNEDEVALVKTALDPLPLLTVYNMLEEAELDSLDMRVYSLGPGRTAVMANAMYGFTCKQHFELKSFPFDSQQLNLDVRFVNSKLWEGFNLIVHGVQYVSGWCGGGGGGGGGGHARQLD